MGNNTTTEKEYDISLPERKVEDWPESKYMAKDLNIMYRVINEEIGWDNLDKVRTHPDIKGHSKESFEMCLRVMLFIRKKDWENYVKASKRTPRPESNMIL